MPSNIQRGENLDWDRIRAAVAHPWRKTELGIGTRMFPVPERLRPLCAGFGVDPQNSKNLDSFWLPVPGPFVPDRYAEIRGSLAGAVRERRMQAEERLTVPDAMSSES